MGQRMYPGVNPTLFNRQADHDDEPLSDFIDEERFVDEDGRRQRAGKPAWARHFAESDGRRPRHERRPLK
ncbi:hypothetical protein [Pelomonas sp. KK5]|uniref:hypothetical protein n=1 Tax=Pelomonas sp. KK5 TaxID=1855730 RepID=UPI001301F6FB|nr:hypothetical protein [Pelomonas sp. KK5]